jgi:hypothetical protein
MVFIRTLELIIAEGSREDLTNSSKLLFELFLKIFDIRSEASLKPKVSNWTSQPLTIGHKEHRDAS